VAGALGAELEFGLHRFVHFAFFLRDYCVAFDMLDHTINPGGFVHLWHEPIQFGAVVIQQLLTIETNIWITRTGSCKPATATNANLIQHRSFPSLCSPEFFVNAANIQLLPTDQL
jgi:hypothetical protein